MFCKLIKYSLFILFFWSNLAKANSADSLITLYSKSNLLYLGIDNPVNLPLSLRKEKNLFITTNNGIAYIDSHSINLIPQKKPDVFIHIQKIIDNDTVSILKKRFFVSYVPKPCILLNNQCLENAKSINKSSILNNPVLKIHFSNDIVGAENWIKIKRFSLGYIRGSIYEKYEVDGNQLSLEMKEAIQRLSPGQQINIKVSVISTGDIIKYLPVYTFSVL